MVKKRTVRLTCGCIHEAEGSEAWVSMCGKHEQEWRETHERWHAELKARRLAEQQQGATAA
jgi:hypothetical protein